MTNTTDDIYRTSDTALAAYLITIGFNYPAIEYENGFRAYYVFKSKDGLDFDQATLDYDTGDFKRFFDFYQALIRRIKERY